MHIGQRILAKRQELGWSQQELANRMGYTSRSAINKIELGINDVKQSNIVKFSEVLGCSIEYLLGMEQAPLSEKEVLVNEIAERLSRLSPEQLQQVLRYAQFLLQTEAKP